MILRQPASLTRRRSAFTLLEVLVVVAIILVLASVATVAVLQIQKENKADIARISAVSLSNSLKTYITKNDGNPPAAIDDILRYVDGSDPSKLLDPWGQKYQIGSQDNNGITNYYVFTQNPETGEQIRSDIKSK